jgi:hypothetical protein
MPLAVVMQNDGGPALSLDARGRNQEAGPLPSAHLTPAVDERPATHSSTRGDGGLRPASYR